MNHSSSRIPARTSAFVGAHLKLKLHLPKNNPSSSLDKYACDNQISIHSKHRNLQSLPSFIPSTYETGNRHNTFSALYMKGSPVRRRRGFFNDNDDDEFDEDEYEEVDIPLSNDGRDENRKDSNVDADADDDREYAYARVGRRRGRFADDYDVATSGDSSSGTSNRQSTSSTNFRDDKDYDFYDFDDEEEDDDFEFISDEYEYDDDEDEDDDVLNIDSDYDGIIPNELLDQIDPDGAIDRLPELFADGKFWRDTAFVGAFVLLYALSRMTFGMNDLTSVDQINFDSFYR